MTTINTTTEPTDLTGQLAKLDGAYRGRRLSWEAFYKERPDLRPDNDDIEKSEKRDAA